MDQETLNTLMSMVILPLLLALSGFAVAWLRKKTQEITANINDATVRKYVDLASDAVTKAVQTTFQTYVDALKAQGKFDKEAQLTALQKAKDTATALITDEAKRVIAEAYGDFDKWLASTIETLVREDKRTAPAACPLSSLISSTAEVNSTTGIWRFSTSSRSVRMISAPE